MTRLSLWAEMAVLGLLFDIMGCCLSKQQKPKKKVQTSQTALNSKAPLSEPVAEQKKQVLEHAKLWLQQSPEKPPKIEQQPLPQNTPPQVPSKRRQLLKELFRQARARQQKPPEKDHKLNIQKMENMQSAPEGADPKTHNISALEQAIRQMVENNKEDLTCCSICTQNYNESRPPMMVCMNQHTYCLQCLRDLWKKGHRKCPLDQTPYNIQNIQKNRLVMEIVSQLPTKQK